MIIMDNKSSFSLPSEDRGKSSWVSITVERNTDGGLDGKESARNAGDPGLIPGSRRSPGEGNSNPLQYSCLENFMGREAWWATVHGGYKELDTTEQLTNTHKLMKSFLTTGVEKAETLRVCSMNFLENL